MAGDDCEDEVVLPVNSLSSCGGTTSSESVKPSTLSYKQKLIIVNLLLEKLKKPIEHYSHF